jgi:hypothetical protein
LAGSLSDRWGKDDIEKIKIIDGFSLSSLSKRCLDVGSKLEWLVAILRPSLVISGNHSVWAYDKEHMLSPLP